MHRADTCFWRRSLRYTYGLPFAVFCCSWVMVVLPISVKDHSLALPTVKSTVKTMAASKSMKNICRSDLHVTFEPYGHFIRLHRSFVPNETTFTMYNLTQWISNPLSKAVPSTCHSSHGIVNATVYNDLINFHRSWSWQIFLFFTTAMVI